VDTSHGSDRGRVHGTVLLGRRGCAVLAASVGATVLTRDRSLRPFLDARLLFTRWAARSLSRVTASPAILTIAGLWMYIFTFVVGASSHAAAWHDAMGAHEHGVSHPGFGGT
jgi:hypothetical protein